MKNKNTKQAAKLAAILIQLQQEYPSFLQDIDPADPDLDLETDFDTYRNLINDNQK